MIGLAALLSWTTTLIPYLIPAVIIAIGGNRRGSPAVWFLAGVGFAFTTAAIWHGTPGRPLVGAALFIVGSLVADAIWIVVAVPTRAGVIKLATRAGIVMPALTRYRRPRAAHADPLMQPAECLRRVRPLVRERVPAELREFQWESFSFQSKLWYGI